MNNIRLKQPITMMRVDNGVKRVMVIEPYQLPEGNYQYHLSMRTEAPDNCISTQHAFLTEETFNDLLQALYDHRTINRDRLDGMTTHITGSILFVNGLAQYSGISFGEHNFVFRIGARFNLIYRLSILKGRNTVQYPFIELVEKAQVAKEMYRNV